MECVNCRYGYLKAEGFAKVCFMEVVPDQHPYGGESFYTEFKISPQNDLSVRIYQNIGNNDEFRDNQDMVPVGDMYIRDPQYPAGSKIRLEWKIDEYGILRILAGPQEIAVKPLGDSVDDIF